MDIQYVTEKPVKLQSVRITRENIIEVAHWVGADQIHVPAGEERWSFSMPMKRNSAFVGDYIVRDKTEIFKVYSPAAFEHRFLLAVHDKPSEPMPFPYMFHSIEGKNR